MIILILLVMSLISMTMFDTKTGPKNLSFKKRDYIELPLPLDLQFDPQNNPSKVFKDVFTGSNIWIGGFNYADKVKTDIDNANYVLNQNALAQTRLDESVIRT